MSRSFKKNSICGHTKSDSEKYDKRLANRKLRRLTREALLHDLEPPTLREVSNPWDMDKDGKSWFDPLLFPEYLRK